MDCVTKGRVLFTDNLFTYNPFTDNPFTDNPFTDNPFTENPFTDNPFTDNLDRIFTIKLKSLHFYVSLFRFPVILTKPNLT